MDLLQAQNQNICIPRVPGAFVTSVGGSAYLAKDNANVFPVTVVDHPGNTFYDCSVTAGDTANLGPFIIVVLDVAGNQIGSVEGNIVTSVGGGLTQADVRTAVGLAAANLDTQLAALAALAAPAALRAALGLAAANLDTQLAGKAVPGSPMTLTAGERTAVADALLDYANAIETGLTPKQALRLAAAILGGVVTLGAGTATFRGAGVATDRVVASVPGDGSRPVMGLNL